MAAEAASPPRFCVLGAGHGGMAMSGHLAMMGVPVKVYNRSEPRIAPIRLVGGDRAIRGHRGFRAIQVATTDIVEAIDGARVLMVVVPANGHRFMAEKVAPHLVDGQVIVLNPGRTGGAFEFHSVLRSYGVKADVIVAEAQTLIYAARAINPAQVRVFGVKNTIPVSALPGQRTVEVVQILRQVYAQFVPGDNVLKTSLDNIGAIFHPALMVLNAARIESTRGEFQFYMEGITPSVSRVLEAVDQERVAVAAALGIRAMSAREWLYVAYDAAGRTLYDAIQNNPGYEGITAPSLIDHRYIWEDVPMSLVPVASLGEMLGVDTKTIRTLIYLASLINATDYWAEGRTVERMGLSGLTARQIRHLSLEGEI